MDVKAAAEIADLRRMMESSGWLVFQRDAKEQMEQLQRTTLDAIKTVEDLAYRKGVVDMLRIIVNYEAVLDAAEANNELDPV
jgi:molecular chaperone GrpE (heat shock protein)